MFSVQLDHPNPDAALRSRAVAELLQVVEVQAVLRSADLMRRRDFLRAKLESPPRGQGRSLGADLEKVESRLLRLGCVRHDPVPVAAAQLESLLRLAGGMVETIEIGDRCLGVRLEANAKPVRVRALLVPEPSRPGRIQMQIYEGSAAPPGILPARQPCLGLLGNAYVDDALDRADLASLVLTVVSYVRTN